MVDFGIDRWLGVAGGILALGATALPWHVWKNPSAYEPPRMTFERLDSDPDMAVFRSRPVRPPPEDEDIAGGEYDMNVTGAVAPGSPRIAAPAIVLANRNHALVTMPSDAGGEGALAILRVGSRFGAGDRIAGFEQVDGIWSVLLASGARLPSSVPPSLQPRASQRLQTAGIELAEKDVQP